MKKQYHRLTGLLLYILLLSVLMRFDWMKMIRPVPLFSVILGILILTLAQYKKGMDREEILDRAQWNSFIAGLMTSLLSLLSTFSPDKAQSISVHRLADGLIPLIYGSIIHLIIRLLNPCVERTGKMSHKVRRDILPHLARQQSSIYSVSPQDKRGNNDSQEQYAAQDKSDTYESLIPLSDPLRANSILMAKGLTPRECHVAFKLIENISNKEIAEQLYISETTVKKHIQNMFRKCGVNDRKEFISLYVQWMKT